jgi:hypothetical protein
MLDSFLTNFNDFLWKMAAEETKALSRLWKYAYSSIAISCRCLALLFLEAEARNYIPRPV